MEYIKTKTILNKVKYNKNLWFGIDYNINLYKGCNHNCIYCDSRSERYRIDNFSKVKAKENSILILEKELKRTKDKGVVGIGSMSDCYNVFEKKYGFTRKGLILLDKYNYGVSLETKSKLILRDIDILKSISEKNNCIVKFTITAFSDELSSKIEPYANISSERFNTMRKLSENNIFTGVLLMPILPYITDTKENIINIIRKSKENGAKFIYPLFGVTLRDIQKEYYLEQMKNIFPLEYNKFINNYPHQYMNYVKNHKELEKIFIEECEKYKLIYKMEDIIKAYKKDNCYSRQMSLFN